VKDSHQYLALNIEISLTSRFKFWAFLLWDQFSERDIISNCAVNVPVAKGWRNGQLSLTMLMLKMNLQGMQCMV